MVFVSSYISLSHKKCFNEMLKIKVLLFTFVVQLTFSMQVRWVPTENDICETELKNSGG